MTYGVSIKKFDFIDGEVKYENSGKPILTFMGLSEKEFLSFIKVSSLYCLEEFINVSVWIDEYDEEID